jgi:hypothetical protein
VRVRSPFRTRTPSSTVFSFLAQSVGRRFVSMVTRAVLVSPGVVSPLAGCPRSRNVFGYGPSPQIVTVPKSLGPGSIRCAGFGLLPHLQLIKVLDGNLALAKPLEQVITKCRRKAGPLNLRHQPPKVMRASSSLSRACSSGSRVRERRSANSQKRFFSRSRALSPDSMRSAMTRLVLVLVVCVSALTRRATRAGRLTLRRTGLAVVGILEQTPPCTIVHRKGASARKSDPNQRTRCKSLQIESCGAQRRDRVRSQSDRQNARLIGCDVSSCLLEGLVSSRFQATRPPVCREGATRV